MRRPETAPARRRLTRPSAVQVRRDAPTSKDNFAFHILTPKRKWLLNAGTAKEWNEWEAALCGVIKAL